MQGRRQVAEGRVDGLRLAQLVHTDLPRARDERQVQISRALRGIRPHTVSYVLKLGVAAADDENQGKM